MGRADARRARARGARAHGQRRADRRVPVGRHRFERRRRADGEHSTRQSTRTRSVTAAAARRATTTSFLRERRRAALRHAVTTRSWSSRTWLTLLPKLLWHLEEPISDSAIATTFLVSELAARDVKVILSGVGGDELFAGYKPLPRRSLHPPLPERSPRWLRRQVLRPLADMLPSGRSSRCVDLARYAQQVRARQRAALA